MIACACTTSKFIASNFQQISTCSCSFNKCLHVYVLLIWQRIWERKVTMDSGDKAQQNAPTDEEFIWNKCLHTKNRKKHFKYESKISIHCFVMFFCVCLRFEHIWVKRVCSFVAYFWRNISHWTISNQNSKIPNCAFISRPIKNIFECKYVVR